MSPPQPTDLGHLEMDILHILWSAREPMSVRAVQEALGEQRTLAYTTVMTVLSRLTQRGLLTRSKQGRGFVYQASVAHEEVAQSFLSKMLQSVFRGGPSALVSHLLAGQDVDDEELEAMARMLEEARRRRGQED